MKYKGYIGLFTFDEKLGLFQGKSMERLEYAFKDAINEYLAWCKKNGKDPENPSLPI